MPVSTAAPPAPLCPTSLQLTEDGASKRTSRIEALAEAGAAGKRNLVRFLWTEAGAQPQLDNLLAVGVTPAVYAVSDDKKVIMPFRGTMDKDRLKSFVVGLTAGRADGAQAFPAAVTSASSLISTVAAWDGKDAVVEPVAEEFSLDEL